ncbi:hypothetical protein L1987_03721 [Smallanthus sonchifolius]|uniref:Uncharacterized protein n=1 Tax=Smallanthus sonchifolius TaxID=185202 RepID=A0ACB9KBN7_9ASTR|nr:hypothetical protein L1987_03721 [Smallanthus sonchifolius]
MDVNFSSIWDCLLDLSSQDFVMLCEFKNEISQYELMVNKLKAEEQCSVWLKSEQSSDPGDIFGEPKKSTQIGDEHQAKIPDIVMKETIQNEANKFIGTVEEDVKLPSVPILDEEAFLLVNTKNGQALG